MYPFLDTVWFPAKSAVAPSSQARLQEDDIVTDVNFNLLRCLLSLNFELHFPLVFQISAPHDFNRVGKGTPV